MPNRRFYAIIQYNINIVFRVRNMPSFTKYAIKISFMKLLNKKPLSKITVKDIVEDCGINRNSFYYHFSDIPSLIEEIFTEETDKLIQSQTESDTNFDCLLSAIDFALENKTAMMHIYNSANRELFEQYLNRVSQHAVARYIDAVSGNYNISDNDKEVIAMYYKSLLVGFVLDWLCGGMKYDLSIKLRRICELFDGSMENAFKNSSKK